MSYNIAKNCLIETNASGTVSLFADQIFDLVDNNLSYGIGNGQSIILDCDIGLRFHTEEIRYYFTPETTMAAVSGTITFYYKDENFENYTSLVTMIQGTSYFYATYSGTFAPRYIRVEQDMGTLSGTLTGFSIMSDDTIVDFGTTGGDTGTSLSMARGDTIIHEVPIYSNDVTHRTALVCIEPEYTEIDDILSVGASSSGPWVSPKDGEVIFADADNFLTHCVLNNLEVRSGALMLIGDYDPDGDYFSTYEFGYFETPITYIGDQGFNRVMIYEDATHEGFIRTDQDDTTKTFEIKYNANKPVDYATFRVLKSNNRYAQFQDYWRDDLTLKYSSSWTFHDAGSYLAFWDHFITQQPGTDRWALFAYMGGTSWNSYDQIYLYINVGESTNYTLHLIGHNDRYENPISYSWRHLEFETDGGIWIYFFGASYSTSHWVNATGYYLAHFDNTLTQTFKFYNQNDFIVQLAVDYNTKHVWYTDFNSDIIQKVATDGTVAVRVTDNVDTLGGITVLSDSKVWHANRTHIYKLDYDGTELDSIEDIASDIFKYMAVDPVDENYLWVIDGFFVKRVLVEGTERGRLDINVNAGEPLRLFPDDSGCWVQIGDLDIPSQSYWKYISKAARKIVHEYTPYRFSKPGHIDYTYDDEQYLGLLPIDIDVNWPPLDWDKVAHSYYYMSEDAYQQVRVVMERQSVQDRYGVPAGENYTDIDEFNQADGDPAKIQLWNSWSDGITVSGSRLVIPATTTYKGINTAKRMILGPGSFTAEFDYVIGDGVSETGGAEYIYLKIYPIDEGFEGMSHHALLYLNSPAASSRSTLYIQLNNGSYSNHLHIDNYARWAGTLRFWYNNTRFESYLYDPISDVWRYINSHDWPNGTYGSYFYVEMGCTSYSNTPLYISRFRVVSADNRFYYTDSPHVTSVHTQKEVEIYPVSPGVPTNAYVKAQVPNNSSISTANSDLRVRWRIPAD
jgi:hypothetical protein